MVGGRGGGVRMSLHSQALPFWHTANPAYRPRRSSGKNCKELPQGVGWVKRWDTATKPTPEADGNIMSRHLPHKDPTSHSGPASNTPGALREFGSGGRSGRYE